MNKRKVGAGAAFVGAVVTGLIGAGSAQAAPGISVSVDGHKPVGIGDPNPLTGASAKSSKGSVALAVKTGLNGVGSFANADGDGATAVSIDGYTSVTGSNSHGFAALGQTNIDGADNNAVTVAGKTNLYGYGNIHGNFVVNAAGFVEQNGTSPQQTTDAGEVSVSLCGASISGQAAHIVTNDNPAFC